MPSSVVWVELLSMMMAPEPLPIVSMVKLRSDISAVENAPTFGATHWFTSDGLPIWNAA